MENMQPSKTSSRDAMIIDFITIRDFLKDSSQYFQNSIELKTHPNTEDDCDNLEMLCERSKNVLRLINDMIKKSLKESPTKADTIEMSESDETTSYLDMSMKKYEGYELGKPKTNLDPNDYVDVTNKATKNCTDDDNIYDNYFVERNGKVTSVNKAALTSQSFDTSSKSETNTKPDCPFNGLPAAHLTIMQSPKIGGLTMHLRRKRFIRRFGLNFKRKYHTGLVMKQDETGYCEWWLLMYAGGPCDLKPTVCLPINQFDACADQPKSTKHADKQSNEAKRNLCKFELNEKNKKKDAKTYCFIAESPEHCEQWIHLLQQLGNGVPFVENTFTTIAQIRKLPMPPLNVKAPGIDRLAGDIDTVDNDIFRVQANLRHEHTAEVCNYSEGVYEEPEEYYKNIPISSNKIPKLPAKTPPSQSAASTIRMDDISVIYDTPKKTVRKSSDAKHYDLVPAKGDATNETKSPESSLECNRLKIDDEIRSKLSTRLKEQSEKYLSSSGQRTSDDEMIRNSSVDGAPNKYQLSTMRKWLFSNHLAKLRQSTHPTNVTRKSSGSVTAEPNVQRPNQRLKTNAVPPSSTDAQKRAFSVQPKGTKVHMIINQLEANGQLTLLSGGGTVTSKSN